jgi:peroxiredoxin
MTIKVGDKVPAGSLKEMGPDGPREVKTDDLFAGKTVAVFAVPGAFTPTCSAKHLPGFVQRADELRGKGVDEIVCLSVNDAFVMGAWGKDQKVGDKVRMMADGSADLTRKMGLELDLNPMGLGTRSRRYSMLVKNGTVTTLNLEEGGGYAVSDADTLLGQL